MDRRPFGKDFWLGELDARHMALFRVLLALVVLWDVGDRLRDFHAFYTDAGLFDHTTPLVHIPFSLGRIMGEPWQAAIVFALAGLGALGMLFGLFTRWSTILTLVAVLGIQHRNPFILDGGDVALRVVLFWSIFIDLGAVASLDARRRGARPTIDALPVRLLQLQVIFLHLATGLLKSGAPWRDGTAVYRALQDTPFTRDTAAWVMAAPWLCALLTWATLALEIGAPLWMYSPWQHGRVRAVGVFATHALHAGIFLTMRVGIFSLIMQVALFACWRAEWIPAWRRTPPAERGTLGSARLLWLAVPIFVAIAVRAATGPLPRPLHQALAWSGLDQRWKMFAPAPPTLAGRWRFPGQRTDGVTLDVADTILPALTNDRPWRFTRWAKYKSQMRAGDDRRRIFLGSYLCRRYRAVAAPPMLDSLTMEYEGRTIVGPNEPPSEATTTRVFYQPCLRPADPPQPTQHPEEQQQSDDGVD